MSSLEQLALINEINAAPNLPFALRVRKLDAFRQRQSLALKANRATQIAKRQESAISYAQSLGRIALGATYGLLLGITSLLFYKQEVRAQSEPVIAWPVANRAFEIGEYVVGIDPALQEERVYQVNLHEVARTRVSTARIAGAKVSAGDGKTPENSPGEYFEITQIVDSSVWRDPFDGQQAYGPYFARIDTPSRRIGKLSHGRSPIGLHGTNEYDKLGMRASHGCIRHANADIAFFVHNGYLRIGGVVVIRSHLFKK